MNLTDPQTFSNIDTQNMLAEIDGLPAQLRAAWELGNRLDLPGWTNITQVLVTGMGGSAIGADLLSAYADPFCKTPISVYRDYGLPASAVGPHTLLIASSHSGNTEETLQTFEEALERGCKCLAVTTGGALEQAATAARVPVWKFEHAGQPRAAVGYSFGLLLAALARLKILPDPQTELLAAIEEMQRQQETLVASVSPALNPAKRFAGQMVGRMVTVFGSELMVPVARRWKTQINELAKTFAAFDVLPEADHNTLAGILQPEDALSHVMLIFLRSPSDHPRNRLRSDLTRKTFMLEGLNTDFVDARGNTPLANMWTCLHLGDYIAYYLAIAYGIDPTPVDALEALKAEMQAAG